MSSPWHFKPRRTLGRTGFEATVLGIGDVADRQIPIDTLVRTVRRAIDAGLNVIDTAPGYEAGYSEEVVGKALKELGGARPMFLVDKIDFMDRPVLPQIEESLTRLGRDHTDAFVFHGVSQTSVWEKLASPGGGFDQLQTAVRAGKTRFRGVSSHHPDVVVAAITSGLCDIVLFPVGAFVDPRYITDALPLARRHNVGTICFKTFGAGKLVGDTQGYNQPLAHRPRGKVSSGGQADGPGHEPVLPRLTARQCIHYTLTCDPDVALLGMSFPNEQDAAFSAATDFSPLTSEQMALLREQAKVAIRDKGDVWWNPPVGAL